MLWFFVPLFLPLTTSPSMLSSDPAVESAVSNGKPYFGMTGTELNIWVTVACTTAMALFGNLFSLSQSRMRPY